MSAPRPLPRLRARVNVRKVVEHDESLHETIGHLRGIYQGVMDALGLPPDTEPEVLARAISLEHDAAARIRSAVRRVLDLRGAR